MSDEGRRLGAALMEENAFRIPNATFTCIVSAAGLELIAEQARLRCSEYFGKQKFEITDLDAEALQNAALEALGYTARVRAIAV